MEGISGLSLVPHPQRSFLNKMIKPSDEPLMASGFHSSHAYGLHPFMPGSLGISPVRSGYGASYGFRPQSNGIPSPKSPIGRSIENQNENEKKGKIVLEGRVFRFKFYEISGVIYIFHAVRGYIHDLRKLF